MGCSSYLITSVSTYWSNQFKQPADYQLPEDAARETERFGLGLDADFSVRQESRPRRAALFGSGGIKPRKARWLPC